MSDAAKGHDVVVQPPFRVPVGPCAGCGAAEPEGRRPTVLQLAAEPTVRVPLLLPLCEACATSGGPPVARLLGRSGQGMRLSFRSEDFAEAFARLNGANQSNTANELFDRVFPVIQGGALLLVLVPYAVLGAALPDLVKQIWQDPTVVDAAVRSVGLSSLLLGTLWLMSVVAGELLQPGAHPMADQLRGPARVMGRLAPIALVAGVMSGALLVAMGVL